MIITDFPKNWLKTGFTDLAKILLITDFGAYILLITDFRGTPLTPSYMEMLLNYAVFMLFINVYLLAVHTILRHTCNTGKKKSETLYSSRAQNKAIHQITTPKRITS